MHFDDVSISLTRPGTATLVPVPPGTLIHGARAEACKNEDEYELRSQQSRIESLYESRNMGTRQSVGDVVQFLLEILNVSNMYIAIVETTGPADARGILQVLLPDSDEAEDELRIVGVCPVYADMPEWNEFYNHIHLGQPALAGYALTEGE
jgi:hypothetical protein